MTPNHPENYDSPLRNFASKTCNWFISVRPDHQILIYFEDFSVEGEQSGKFSLRFSKFKIKFLHKKKIKLKLQSEDVPRLFYDCGYRRWQLQLNCVV